METATSGLVYSQIQGPKQPLRASTSVCRSWDQAGHVGSYDNRHFRSVRIYRPPQLCQREIRIPLRWLSAFPGGLRGGGREISKSQVRP